MTEYKYIFAAISAYQSCIVQYVVITGLLAGTGGAPPREAEIGSKNGAQK